jgi:hypothetical protein
VVVKQKRGIADWICLAENERWRIVNSAAVFRFHEVAGNSVNGTEIWEEGFAAYVDGCPPEGRCDSDAL